jgi:hypothetical protein
MTTTSKFIQFILDIEPDFREDYQSYLKFMNGEFNSHGVASAFSGFVGKRLKIGEYKNAASVFNGMETLLAGNNADEDIKNAVCTCFLENLLNQFSEDLQVLNRFVPLLGPESIKYCKAWDEFTGVQTHGLWGKDKPKMKSANKLTDEEALAIIKAIKNREYKNEAEEDSKIRVLEIAIPGISNLLFYDRRNLTPEQILEEAKNRK